MRSFKRKPFKNKIGKQERYLCLIFTEHMYAVEKKTYSDITPSLTSFLGAEKKTIIYIYIPHTGSSYFRFVSTNINHLLLDPTSFFASFRRVIMQFSTALLFNKTGVTLCCLVKFLDV